MRLKHLFIFVTGLLFASAVAAQTATPTPQVAPPPPVPENIWNLDLSTGGRVSIQLRPDIAPNHVERIKTLTRQGFYNGLTFHRVIEGFMAQGGDPKGDGTGGSDLPDLAAEFNILPHVRGTVSAARAEDVNSANSQFFIMLAPRLSLDRKYTPFGRVISGMAYVDAITKGEPPAAPSRIVRASLGSDNVPPPPPGAAQQAVSAAAGTAAQQSLDAALSATAAEAAAELGHSEAAAEQANAAAVAAEGAAQAAKDAAEAARKAEPKSQR